MVGAGAAWTLAAASKLNQRSRLNTRLKQVSLRLNPAGPNDGQSRRPRTLNLPNRHLHVFIWYYFSLRWSDVASIAGVASPETALFTFCWRSEIFFLAATHSCGPVT